MRTTIFPALALALSLCSCGPKPAPVATTPAAATMPTPSVVATPSVKPPVAAKRPEKTTIHGGERVDDYAWMKKKDDPAVLEYLKAENAYTDSVLAPLAGLRKKIYDEMLSRIDENDVSVPYRDDGFWYYSRWVKGQQYPIYCRKKAGAKSETYADVKSAEEVLLDPNEIAKVEKYVGVGELEVSDDGKKLAFTVDVTGFREYALQVKDLATGKLSSEKIEDVGSVTWAPDNKTIFYVTQDDAERPYRLWRHTLGADPKKDVLVYEEKDERFGVGFGRSADDKFFLLGAGSHTTSEWRYLDARTPRAKFKLIAPRIQDQDYSADHKDGKFWIVVNDTGRNNRLVTASDKTPGRKHWKEVLPHRDDVMLERVSLFKDHIVLSARKDALPHLVVVPDEGDGWLVPVDEGVYSLGMDRNAEYDTGLLRYRFVSFTTPPTTYDLDLATKQKTLLKRQPVKGDFDSSRYVSERVWATAADGTKIPISVVRKKGVAKDGTAPLFITGYGSYGASYPVTFSSNRLSLLDRGVVFAVAHIRGGGDMGKKWHDAGRMMNKKSTFSDFISCTEALVTQGYGAKSRVGINGGSAGGLLMGAVVNRRPDLFKAVIADVPFVDVVNTMLDESLPLTVGEFEEWGNPKEKPAYDYMMSYSPYDNVKAQAYPAMLVTSSLNDSQVLYHEPTKWVAKLRTLKTDTNPLLLRMNIEPAGHGGKSGRYERLEEEAFRYAFLLWQLGAS